MRPRIYGETQKEEEAKMLNEVERKAIIDTILEKARLLDPRPCADRERYIAEKAFEAGENA